MLIKIKTFGLNRSELFIRRGDSPEVKFPRIQGIECVRIIEDSPSKTYKKDQQIAAIMGGNSTCRLLCRYIPRDLLNEGTYNFCEISVFDTPSIASILLAETK